MLDVGDRRTFFAFADRDSAREFARQVRKVVGRHPPWKPYPAESWRVDSSRFRPRPALNGRGAHGFTMLEEIVGEVLVKERRLALRAAKRRSGMRAA